jgi:hypothetical protein
MHFLGASRDGLVARRVDLDMISSSVNEIGHRIHLLAAPFSKPNILKFDKILNKLTKNGSIKLN